MNVVFASSFLTGQILSWALPLAIFAAVCVWFLVAGRGRGGQR